ncbi:MAG: SAM-dependent chlorinase/fluorinase [Ktedonobacterales bacterium]|nr:SAM-dependent chlorinase/fluorinase [Ktedonobacterales bacterium]
MFVALLTDFGLTDTYVGVIHAIIASIAPGATIVDLTHAVRPQDVVGGAWLLSTSIPYLPSDALVLAIVDPGVGTKRRPVALRSQGRLFVAPDNGLLTRVLTEESTLESVTLDRERYWLPGGVPTSSTFHGRDIFAPVAAHLAAGVALAEVGSAIAPATLTRLTLSVPAWQGDVLAGHVIHIDHFGNIITDLGPDLLPRLFAAERITAHVGRRVVRARATTFGEGPGSAPFWYPDSSGHAAIAWRNDSAALRLGVGVGTLVRVEGFAKGE